MPASVRRVPRSSDVRHRGRRKQRLLHAFFAGRLPASDAAELLLLAAGVELLLLAAGAELLPLTAGGAERLALAGGAERLPLAGGAERLPLAGGGELLLPPAEEDGLGR